MKITPPAIQARRLSVLALLTPLAFLAACASDSGHPKPDTGHGPGSAVPITLDGNIEEWPTNAALLADDQYIYFHVITASKLIASSIVIGQTPNVA